MKKNNKIQINISKHHESKSEKIDLHKKLVLLPLTDRPFFPSQALPIVMTKDPWIDSIKKITEKEDGIAGFIFANHVDDKKITSDDFYTVGTSVRIHHPVVTKDKIQFIAEGIQRFKIKKCIKKTPPYIAEVTYSKTTYKDLKKIEAYGLSIINIIKELIPLNPIYSEELRVFLNRFTPNDPTPLADFAATLTRANKEELQEILEEYDLVNRMEKVLILLKKELELTKLQTEIRRDVENKISSNQRTFFLKEELKAIQKELGVTKDDKTADKDLFENKLKDLKLSPEAQERVQEEFDKLSVLETGSPEYSVTRNYLELVTNLPWGIYSDDNLSLRHAKSILNQEHSGLADVKTRIIEFIATGVMRGHIGGSIILFVGPPGVGKTSIGRSIANALNRSFYRFSVGGMRDEAEIKGHRRTYIGAMPGKIIQGIKTVHTSNPVIMLDEIDKIGTGYRGDPSSALLEVLDPEQNQSFLDHYLDIRFDLSKVLFICTANQLDTIPRPLLDRMEIIHLAGYITEEKIAIAKQHLWPHQLKNAGIKKTQLTITDSALHQVIDGYAREAGVRTLEKRLGKITRRAAVQFVNKKVNRIHINLKNLTKYLDAPIYRDEEPLEGVGIITGLAWTPLGGVTLSVEASCISEKHRGYKLTGNLGDVMRESAEIAYSYVAGHAKEYGIDPNFFESSLIHIHVPEGAVSKDGPSAGITIASAIISLARKQKPRKIIAMTGEITLTGHVLAIGGIREKITAAKRAKLTEIIIPKSVLVDYKELPTYIRKGLKIHAVDHYKQVFKLLF